MIIGLTGSIASGKSLVSNYLKQKNYQIIDCDEISHYVLTIPSVILLLEKEFGKQIIIDGVVNRKLLAEIVFNDVEKKSQLELIVFPEILEEIKKQIKEKNGIVFLDAPLLFEYNLEYLTEKIIVVKSDKEVQMQRLIKRDNINEEYALKKIHSQLPIEEKEKYANFIIDNSLSIENTYNQVDQILKLLEEQ